jgi:hypothetical protein
MPDRGVAGELGQMTTMRRMGGQRSNPVPLSPKDLKTLIEMGLVEMRMLTKRRGIKHLINECSCIGLEQ